MFSRDIAGSCEFNQFVCVFENAQFYQLSDHFEGLKSEESGQFTHLNVIRNEDPPAGLIGLQQVSRGEFGRPGWRLRRSA